MEQWHTTKVTKYTGLHNIITSNNWTADLFAVEVGARGYPSNNVHMTLKKLGFSNKLARKTSKLLGYTAMKSSFCIWLGRNSAEWNPDDLRTSLSSKVLITTCNKKQLPTPTLSTDKVIKQTPRPPIDKLHPRPHAVKSSPKFVGFINKGNTCYANSILQALSVIPAIWNHSHSDSHKAKHGHISPIAKSLILNMTLKKRSKKPLDPLGFLWALKRKMSSIQPTPFEFNTQQDVPEILQAVLDELIGTSTIALNTVTTTLRSSITCNKCQCCSEEEQKLSIVPVPLQNSISCSINKLLSSEILAGDNKWLCPICKSLEESSKDTIITCCGDVLIIHLLRYNSTSGNTCKDSRQVLCYPNDPLKIPIHVDETVSVLQEYTLMATINHSGNMNSGHYWAIVRQSKLDDWFCCDDKRITKTKSTSLSNKSSYVLFFIKNK